MFVGDKLNVQLNVIKEGKLFPLTLDGSSFTKFKAGYTSKKSLQIT